MTVTELMLALDDDMERRGPTGMQDFAQAGDPAEYALQWRARTLADRLKRSREG